MISQLPPDVAELWPYEPRWTTVGGYRLHHIDEGPRDSTEAVVLLAGNPTWGFLYRDIIPTILDAGFRVLALDYLGMGRSDHGRRDEEYAIQHHADRVRAQLRGAGVTRAVLFMQDWAGPIGLTAALDQPGLLAGMVLANTFWGEQSEFQKNAMGWRSLHAPVSGALLLKKRRSFTSALKLSGPPAIHGGAAWKAYNLPFDVHTSPGSTYTFPRNISTGPGHPTYELARRIYDAMPTDVFDVPTRFVWGDKDAVFTREEQEATFRSRFPRARSTRLSSSRADVTSSRSTGRGNARRRRSRSPRKRSEARREVPGADRRRHLARVRRRRSRRRHDVDGAERPWVRDRVRRAPADGVARRRRGRS